MLSDCPIRKSLISALEEKNKSHPYRIIEEMSVCDGKARIDIAVANGRLCGYEIKSDMDTLERLGNQIECYEKIFDRITIVVGTKYEQIITKEIPSWWGIIVAVEDTCGKVKLKRLRLEKSNPNIESKELVTLLWKEEIISLLKDNGVRGISSKSRLSLRDIAVEVISRKEIKSYVRETLKMRTGWRPNFIQSTLSQ